MGDRVSIQFVNNGEKSIVLFDHWGGKSFPEEAQHYVLDVLPKRIPTRKNGSDPGSRREPNTIMVDFVSWMCHGEIISSSFYFGKTEKDGDNSDNGHYEIDLITGSITHTPYKW